MLGGLDEARRSGPEAIEHGNQIVECHPSLNDRIVKSDNLAFRVEGNSYLPFKEKCW